MRLLLVEDNRSDVELLRESFVELELDPMPEVAVVAHPDECVAALGRAAWDWILVDLRLGPHCGHDLLQTIAGSGVAYGGRLLVLSSSAAPNDIVRALEHDIHGYIRKPFTFDGWVQLARYLLDESTQGELDVIRP